MFDPQYKNWDCIWELVGKELTKIVVYECDKKTMISLLIKVNHFFNLVGWYQHFTSCIFFIGSIFDVIMLTKEVSGTLFVFE
jgi:hypothetical protein